MPATTTFSPGYGMTSGAAAPPKRKSLFHRFLDRLIEARARRADEFICQHSHLLPRDFEEQAGWRLTERNEDSLPFIR
jgi:hypothetical protein